MRSEHLLYGNELRSEGGSVSLGSLHGSLQDLGGVHQLQLVNRRQDVGVGEVRLLLDFFSLVVLHLGVDSRLGLVVYPLAHKQLVLVVVVVTALAFPHVVYPVTLEVVSVSLRQNSVTVSFSFVPLTFINVFVGVDHSAFSLRHSIDPVAIVPVPVLVEESASAVLLVLVPIPSVLPPEFAAFVPPVRALPVSAVLAPHSFVFVAMLVELNAEALFAVVLPVANVPRGLLPLLSLYAAVLLALLFLAKALPKM